MYKGNVRVGLFVRLCRNGMEVEGRLAKFLKKKTESQLHISIVELIRGSSKLNMTDDVRAKKKHNIGGQCLFFFSSHIISTIRFVKIYILVQRHLNVTGRTTKEKEKEKERETTTSPTSFAPSRSLPASKAP